LLLGLQYTLFYAFILDRLGVHLYMIFSPRTNLSILAWSIVLGVTVYCYSFWDAVVANHGQYWIRYHGPTEQ
jgi:hypothetical protein